MAITTSFEADVKYKFNPQYWDSIDEFEDYVLRRIQETMADRNYYTDRNGIERQIDFINHHPELHEYEVWMEGYAATGERSDATLLGKTFARNFAQACDIIMCKSHLEDISECNNPNYTQYCPPRKWDYDTNKLSVWGCGLYWSEKLARKSFG
jgi:hypothetical protein